MLQISLLLLWKLYVANDEPGLQMYWLRKVANFRIVTLETIFVPNFTTVTLETVFIPNDKLGLQ